jgi:hypothetical protein
VPRPALEVADIFRDHGAAWRRANAGHVSLDQLKVMSAIERCRTVALGGHVARCEDCADTVIAYNSCRNRHCPKCQGAAAKEWLAEREAELLPVGYFHIVFTLPGPIADIAYHNKAAIYGLLFTAAAEATMTIAADPKRLGARIGITAVLHTWGSAMTHHPHVHMIVPGGGISLDHTRWVSCRPGFFLPVRVLSHLFRRLFLGQLLAQSWPCSHPEAGEYPLSLENFCSKCDLRTPWANAAAGQSTAVVALSGGRLEPYDQGPPDAGLARRRTRTSEGSAYYFSRPFSGRPLNCSSCAGFWTPARTRR